MALKHFTTAHRAVMTLLIFAMWMPCTFFGGRLLEERYNRDKAIACARDGIYHEADSPEPVPTSLRRFAQQLRTDPNRRTWCGRRPADAYGPDDDRFSAVRWHTDIRCFSNWKRYVPLAVPYAWTRDLPATEAYEAVVTVSRRAERYQETVEKKIFRACKANEHTRGTYTARVALPRFPHEKPKFSIEELPNHTWYAEVSPELIEDFATHLETFADEYDAALAGYEPQRHYLLYLSILAVVVWLALLLLIGVLGGSVLQDVKDKILKLDD